jgi:hypothetical protein
MHAPAFHTCLKAQAPQMGCGGDRLGTLRSQDDGVWWPGRQAILSIGVGRLRAVDEA